VNVLSVLNHERHQKSISHKPVQSSLVYLKKVWFICQRRNGSSALLSEDVVKSVSRKILELALVVAFISFIFAVLAVGLASTAAERVTAVVGTIGYYIGFIFTFEGPWHYASQCRESRASKAILFLAGLQALSALVGYQSIFDLALLTTALLGALLGFAIAAKVRHWYS
jgi:hypothetical protein